MLHVRIEEDFADPIWRNSFNKSQNYRLSTMASFKRI
jgi:hypothetical protein